MKTKLKRITVLDRHEMKRIKDENPDLFKVAAVISINDPEDGSLFKTWNDNLISFYFHDIPMPRRGYIAFNTEHAEDIINFLHEINVEQLFIHCFAGISRSGAVAKFVQEYFQMDYQEFIEQNRQIQPNRYILNLLWEVAHEPARRGDE